MKITVGKLKQIIREAKAQPTQAEADELWKEGNYLRRAAFINRGFGTKSEYSKATSQMAKAAQFYKKAAKIYRQLGMDDRAASIENDVTSILRDVEHRREEYQRRIKNGHQW